MSNEHQRLYALTEHILKLMQQNQGPIPFQTWMNAALYAPKLGYYESEEVFGKAGDFTTSTAMGQWLALGFAESIAQSWSALGKPETWTLLEQGGGSGVLLCDVLQALGNKHIQPTTIIAVEKSEQLRQRQQQRYAQLSQPVEQYATLAAVPPIDTAIMLSNELPDAFPASCFVWQDKTYMQRLVDWDGEKFVWQTCAALATKHCPTIREEIKATWADGYISEFNPSLTSWQQAVAKVFRRGIVLTVDYGYSQQEYYRPQRIEGTLMGHYQHHVVEDVLQLSPGLCDITAHIDFSALKQAGESAGLSCYAYISQGAWLAQCPSIQQALQRLAENPTVESLAQISHAKRLMLPTGMGESFKLMIQGKGLHDTSKLRLPAFDRYHTL